MCTKHAYLIIAHNKFDILEKIVKLLDHDENDIYIHIDKKTKTFNFSYFESICQKSKLFFIERISVNWGGFSLIKCELLLLKSATKRKYVYYHLISGCDLPLKNQENIHEFFRENDGIEYIHFVFGDINSRIDKYYFFQEYRKSSNILKKYLSLMCEKISLFLQKIFSVDRLKCVDYEVKYGANWFSITHELANYVISKEDWIKRHFCYSFCADEIFLQTLVYNSQFIKKIAQMDDDNSYLNCLRKIDWNRGKPYVWRIKDYDELINSEYLFARKFDSTLDNEIVEKIYENIKNK